MNRILEVCLVALTLAASFTPSAAAKLVAGCQNSPFAGTWEGSINNLPGINLKIQEVDRNVSGNIVFYFQQRTDPRGARHVAGETAVPLLAPHVEGNTLAFEVEHHKCQGCAELGPNVKFRVALAGTNEARLWNLGEHADPDPGLKLVRGPDASAGAAQTLQKGISVQLPVASNATPMPDADNQDARIVAVTKSGSVYLGTDLFTPDALAEKIKGSLPNGDQKLYIKADASTPYANVEKVLDGAHTAGVGTPILLTAQPKSSETGTRVSPKGLEVLLVPPPGSQSTAVQVINSGQQEPALRINNRQIPWANLQTMLTQLFQDRSKKVVLVEADGRLPFADVVQVIDACQSFGAKVFLAAPRQ